MGKNRGGLSDTGSVESARKDQRGTDGGDNERQLRQADRSPIVNNQAPGLCKQFQLANSPRQNNGTIRVMCSVQFQISIRLSFCHVVPPH